MTSVSSPSPLFSSIASLKLLLDVGQKWPPSGFNGVPLGDEADDQNLPIEIIGTIGFEAFCLCVIKGSFSPTPTAVRCL